MVLRSLTRTSSFRPNWGHTDSFGVSDQGKLGLRGAASTQRQASRQDDNEALLQRLLVRHEGREHGETGNFRLDHDHDAGLLSN